MKKDNAEQLALNCPEGWWIVPRDNGIAIEDELSRELSVNHPLLGRTLTALARAEGSDDVLLEALDGTLVEVHLTWSGRRETAPWPRYSTYADLSVWRQHVDTEECVILVYARGTQMRTSKVGIREFRENLSSYLESKKPVAITRHGATIGVYVPTKPEPTQEQLEAIRTAGEKMRALIEAAGTSEEELIADFEEWRRSKRR